MEKPAAQGFHRLLKLGEGEKLGEQLEHQGTVGQFSPDSGQSRRGDSPVIGAGTYADNRSCAVSATGWGEFFIRVGVARMICARIDMKDEGTQEAADAVIAEVGDLGGDGGVIVVDPDGNALFAMNTSGMYRARATSGGVNEVAIYADE